MSDPRRLGVMGGTFDPIHNGHLVCASQARSRFDLDEVVFIPAGVPWQKEAVSAAEDRYLMTVLATSRDPGFSVSRIEIDRPGPTYTIDTLRLMHEFHDDETRMYLILGADAIADILSWKEPEMIAAIASIVVARRPEVDPGAYSQLPFEDRIISMDIPALAISSTDIRRRSALGEPIRYLVPDDVADFIEDRKLYSREEA